MLTIIVLMYVLTGVAVSLIVLSSYATTVVEMNKIDEFWLVLRYVLGWPVMLYKAFHKGELGLV